MRRLLNASARGQSRPIVPKHPTAVRAAETARRFSQSRGGDAPDSRPITAVWLYRVSKSASADVSCSRLFLNLGAGRGLGRKLQHGRELFLREACQQNSMTIRKFN